MLISPLLTIMNNFLPLLVQEQFNQLPEIVRKDFTSNYEKFSRFIVHCDLCERYSENAQAVLTNEEVECLASIIKERALLITKQLSPFQDVNPDSLLLGNTFIEKISNYLTIYSKSMGENPIKNPKPENSVSVNKTDCKEVRMNPKLNKGPVKIIRNRIRDLNIQPDSNLTKGAAGLGSLSHQTKTQTKNNEDKISSSISHNFELLSLRKLAHSHSKQQAQVGDRQKNKNYSQLDPFFFNEELPLKKRKLNVQLNSTSKKSFVDVLGLAKPTLQNSVKLADFGYSDEETPEVISDIEETIENILPNQNSINTVSNLNQFDTGIVTPEFISEEESFDIEEFQTNNTYTNHSLNRPDLDFGIPTPEIHLEKITPISVTVDKEPSFTLPFDDNEVPRQAIIFDESLIITAAMFSKKEDIKSAYNRAKKELRIIHNTFQNESAQLEQYLYDTNHYSFKPEEKAIKSLKKISSLQRQVSLYNFGKGSMEMSLKAVRTELEFINLYLINEYEFKDEIAKLVKCRQACTAILSSKIPKSENFKSEARDLNDSLINYYLPITHFNFAVYNFKEINNKVLVASEDDSFESLDELIGDLEKSVTHLKNAYNLLKKTKQEAELKIVVNFLAKSYEDLADFRSKKVDLMLEQNQNDDSLLNLLKEIKSNYQESYSYINDNEIWLSIFYTQHRLIEAYTDNKYKEFNTNYLNLGLVETSNMVDELIKKGLSTIEESSTQLELLYYLLYACSKAYCLTNCASKEFQKKALNFIKVHIDHISKIDNTCDMGNLSTEIIDSLVQLNLINKAEKWTLQSAINEVCGISKIDNQPSNIDSIVYIKEISTPEKKKKTTLTINYKDSVNLHNNQKEFKNSDSRNAFFHRDKPQQGTQTNLNCDTGFRK
ncbi:MAG: hypothetical protein H0U57_03330 [Tatlockia sp.]|nr:hypothetical protein [Tatlockia sp.]